MGIYGFLSSSYQETANKAGNIDAQVTLVEVKRDNIKEQLAMYIEEKTSINATLIDLRKGLSNNTIQYKDSKTGEIITTTSSATRKALENQLDQTIERQIEINSKVDGLNEQLFNYETEIVGISTDSNLAGELGPLKYLSGLTGVPMDKIINYLILIIIFVFDPLAIALVIAANFAFGQLGEKYKKNIYGEKVLIEPKLLLATPPIITPTKIDTNSKDRIDTILNKTTPNNEEENIKNISGVSGWRKNKMLVELKKNKKDNNNDLTITY